MRDHTRRQRYDQKNKDSLRLPVSFVTINFDYSDNLAYVIRTAACYGARNIYVIGSIPPRKFLNPKSGSLYDYVNLTAFKNPSSFLKYSRDNNIDLISAEITDSSVSLYDYQFNLNRRIGIVLGHETTGIPVEIALNSTHVYVPMPGPGFCLNTSQTGTAFITEYSRQYFASR
jgi:tRNA G18 (ribose-2'-O)-methylase SpoU